jgi:predicted ester cyclase
MDPSATNKTVVERFDALVNSAELDELDVLCTPDMINHALAPDRPAGLDGTREFLRTASRFRSDGWRELIVVAEGDYVVQYGVRAGQWPGGPFLGVSAPPGPYARGTAFMYRLVEGRIAERWAVRDDLGMLRQLGALPSP